MSSTFAKRAASKIMKRGVQAIRIKPEALQDSLKALTTEDVRKLIEKGSIYATPEKHNKSRKAKFLKKARSEGRRRGIGKRRGTDKARSGVGVWEKKVRSQRRLLRQLRIMNKLDKKTFRDYYRHVKGNEYATKAALLLHLRESGIEVTDDEVKKIREAATNEYK